MCSIVQDIRYVVNLAKLRRIIYANYIRTGLSLNGQFILLLQTINIVCCPLLLLSPLL